MITDQEALDYIKGEMLKIEPWKSREKNAEKLDEDIAVKTIEIAKKYIPLREAEKDEKKRKKIAYQQNAELAHEIKKLKE